MISKVLIENSSKSCATESLVSTGAPVVILRRPDEESQCTASLLRSIVNYRLATLAGRINEVIQLLIQFSMSGNVTAVRLTW